MRKFYKLIVTAALIGIFTGMITISSLAAITNDSVYAEMHNGAQVYVNQVSLGLHGITGLETVREKKTALSLKCKELAEMVAGKSAEEKVRFLHDYLKNNCTYDYSFSKYTAYDCLIGGSSVCQGYAEAFYNLCKTAGVGVQYVSGTADNGQQIGGHSWNRVKLSDGNWYEVDVCWDSCLGRDDYFLLSKEKMEIDHFPETYFY